MNISERTNNETKLLCCHCDLKDVCTKRAHKEQYEQSGWMTRCTLTPNKRKPKVKK